MIRRSWTRTASIEETLALWAASLREIKTRIRPLFGQVQRDDYDGRLPTIKLAKSGSRRVARIELPV
jgi:hypothetical protein